MAKAGLCCIDGCGKVTRLAYGMCTLHYQRWRRHGDPLKTVIKVTERGEVAAFLENIVFQYRGSDCLIWPYNNVDGRGTVRQNGRTRLVSRLACEAVHGKPASDGLEAAHSCGNGGIGCVNPMHLRWATHTENEADKVGHGTSQHGENNHQAKLTNAEVTEIRALSGNLSQRAIAVRYGVTQSAISMIANGKRR